jgi:hypothetical protein
MRVKSEGVTMDWGCMSGSRCCRFRVHDVDNRTLLEIAESEPRHDSGKPSAVTIGYHCTVARGRRRQPVGVVGPQTLFPGPRSRNLEMQVNRHGPSQHGCVAVAHHLSYFRVLS